ncbi:hypothetical protein FQN60_011673 [Etheostoma spectabile]|uniref:Uncharacterized protein n=1 Tax=Etheostoma spectabile TaxID=54343 RepID=A0A5J5DMY7_9PERO|nr:hypothetical protein FQN60_011673 [Etheostoma spectabile]
MTASTAPPPQNSMRICQQGDKRKSAGTCIAYTNKTQKGLIIIIITIIITIIIIIIIIMQDVLNEVATAIWDAATS